MLTYRPLEVIQRRNVVSPIPRGERGVISFAFLTRRLNEHAKVPYLQPSDQAMVGLKL